MDKDIFKLEEKGDRPVLAICYDFDKTLSPDDMQAQGYIQSVGYNINEFWKESNALAHENDMDQNLAYMLMMVEKSHGKFYVTRESLADYGSKVKLFKGVEDWFQRIKKYGEKKNLLIEHYIISSGLKEMIEGTKMARESAFKKIYASSYYFDSYNVAKWPAQAINYTNKTQFLYRIEKGVLDINDQRVNDYFTPDKIRVPFRNMVYIGDSATDIPCMKLVNMNGGYSIGVYNPDTKDKSKVYNMIHENRIKYFVPADYTEGSELDNLIKYIVDRTVANECMENQYFKYKHEADEHEQSQKEGQKNNTVSSLVNSRSFTTTHTVISKLSTVYDWNNSQLEQIFYAGANNGQVFSILKDSDIALFYESIFRRYTYRNDDAEKIITELHS